jgi:hypothetical protein
VSTYHRFSDFFAPFHEMTHFISNASHSFKVAQGRHREPGLQNVNAQTRDLFRNGNLFVCRQGDSRRLFKVVTKVYTMVSSLQSAS